MLIEKINKETLPKILDNYDPSIEDIDNILLK